MAAFVSGSASLPAHASAADPPGPVTNHHRVGNGRHNRNILSVRSPTHNRGYQHTNNSNAGGLNDVQNALCRNSTVCNVTQKVIIVTPEKPAPPAAAATPPTGTPEHTGAIQPQVRPDVRPETRPGAPAVEAPTHSPFLYMGPYGFMMVASDSSTPLGFRSDSTGSFALPGGFIS